VIERNRDPLDSVGFSYLYRLVWVIIPILLKNSVLARRPMADEEDHGGPVVAESSPMTSSRRKGTRPRGGRSIDEEKNRLPTCRESSDRLAAYSAEE
jgi:hypothetical protein